MQTYPFLSMTVRCSVCQSSEWWRCHPGQGSDAVRFQGVLEFDADPDVPALAFCLGCDPEVVRS